MRPHIAIVGGGIAGLALAAILDPRRFDVTLYEAQPGRTGGGTALAMWPSAQRLLRRLGADELLADAARTREGSMFDASGRALVTMRGTDGLLLVSRPGLLRALGAAVPDSVRRATARVVPGDLPGIDADLVVGADGVHSVVRRVMCGAKAVARPTEFIAVRGVVPPLPGVGFGEHWGRGALFGVTPVPGGRYNWFCSYRSELGPRDIDVEDALTDARHRFAGFGPEPRAVLAAAAPESTLAQRIWVAPPLRSYVRISTASSVPPASPMALIGDAAHAMMPNLGRGACESLIDAHVLGDALNGLPLPDALREYDRRRVPRTQLARAGSRAMAGVALARRTAPPRDLLMRVLGSATARLSGV